MKQHCKHLTSFFHSLILQNVQPTNKRYLIAVDVNSSSKSGGASSNFLSPVVAAAAMTMTVARTEQQYQLVVGSDKIVPAELTAKLLDFGFSVLPTVLSDFPLASIIN